MFCQCYVEYMEFSCISDYMKGIETRNTESMEAEKDTGLELTLLQCRPEDGAECWIVVLIKDKKRRYCNALRRRFEKCTSGIGEANNRLPQLRKSKNWLPQLRKSNVRTLLFQVIFKTITEEQNRCVNECKIEQTVRAVWERNEKAVCHVQYC